MNGRLTYLIKENIWLILILIFLFIIPITRNPFILATLFTIFSYITMAEGYNILGGYGGYVNFGYSAFYGLGAYLTAILYNQFKIPPLLAIPIATITVASISALLGIPLLRIRGVYFAIAMITVNYIFYSLILLFPEITGAGSGIALPPPPPLTIFYYTCLVIMLCMIFIKYKLMTSSFGLAIKSIREDEDVAEVVGVNTALYKIIAFVISITPAAIIGGITATYWSYIDPPTMFDIGMSVKIILMVRLGGPGTIFGPVLGTILIQTLSYALRYTLAGVLHKIIWGALLTAVVIFLPNGIIQYLKEMEWLPVKIRRVMSI